MGRCALLAIAVLGVFLAIWEIHWRSQGAHGSYRNSEGLWAIQRRRIDHGEGADWVFTGSSRTLSDLQLDVWQQESGQRPIQLALEGTSPLRVMEDLAKDSHFTGTLLVGVSPNLFFSGFEFRKDVLDRYPRETPAQWSGQQISMWVEPYLAFYNFDFSLFTVLKRQPWPKRAGVQSRMDVRKLFNLDRDRNTRMWAKLETDVAYQDIAKQVWMDGFVPIAERKPEEIERTLRNRGKQIERAVAATKSLQSKGVEVIFVRHPSEGHYAVSEPMFYPREDTWDVLIEKTGALGIHWQDHPELQGFPLPEWSHMTAAAADRYSHALYHVMKRERQMRVADRL